jgi:hypothetical protein
MLAGKLPTNLSIIIFPSGKDVIHEGKRVFLRFPLWQKYDKIAVLLLSKGALLLENESCKGG